MYVAAPVGLQLCVAALFHAVVSPQQDASSKRPLSAAPLHVSPTEELLMRCVYDSSLHLDF